MLFKGIGLFLLFSFSTLWGMCRADALRCAVREMELTDAFLREFAVLLKNSMAPPGEIVRRLSVQSGLRDCALLSALERECRQTPSFSLAMERAVAQWPLTRSRAAQILTALGEEIGARDVESELSAIEAARILLEQELSDGRERAQRHGPLFQRLGLLGGLLLVILLI